MKEARKKTEKEEIQNFVLSCSLVAKAEKGAYPVVCADAVLMKLMLSCLNVYK